MRTGRNNEGKLTIRFRGGGHKRVRTKVNEQIRGTKNLRVIKLGNKPTILRSIVDNSVYRNKNIESEERHWIIESFNTNPFTNEDERIRLPLLSFRVGERISDISIREGDKSRVCKAKGQSGQIIKQTERWTIIKLRNKKIITIDSKGTANKGETTGDKRKLRKAGQKRWMGIRPRVSGENMNPVDHPNGGRTRGGRIAKTKWGKKAKGIKTARKEWKQRRLLNSLK